VELETQNRGIEHRERPWWALAVVVAAELMVVLDGTVMNIALPSVQESLDMSDADRQWVIAVYALTFGGLLLIGGRLADRFGHRRVFGVALVGFAVASAAGGAATTAGALIAARAVQGVFAAMLSPAVLSLLAISFSEVRQRAKAYGVFSAAVGGGAALGLLAGGAITQTLGWQWCLFINVPIAVLALVLSRLVLPGTDERTQVRIGWLSGLLGCLGPLAVVYGLSQAPARGWGAPAVLGSLTVGVVLVAVFLLVQARTSHPLLPLHVVVDRSRAGSFTAGLALNFGVMGVSLFATYQLQDAMAYSPVETGLAFLPMIFAVGITATVVAPRLLSRVSARWVVCAGLSCVAAGILLFARLDGDASYVVDVLPAWLLLGTGAGLTIPTTTHLAVLDVEMESTGVASAFQTASRQIGGALGLAFSNTLAVRAATSYAESNGGSAQPQNSTAAMVHGAATAAVWTGAVVLGAMLLATTLITARRTEPANTTTTD
jgi:EmrB/QacA subfamily drug resistance transporter